MRALMLGAVLACAGVAWAAQCRDSVWCRYHEQEAYLTTEWETSPTGEMWRVYEHGMANGNAKHRLLVPCE